MAMLSTEKDCMSREGNVIRMQELPRSCTQFAREYQKYLYIGTIKILWSVKFPNGHQKTELQPLAGLFCEPGIVISLTMSVGYTLSLLPTPFPFVCVLKLIEQFINVHGLHQVIESA